MLIKVILVIATIISLLILENKLPFFSFQNSLKSRISSNLELGIVNSIISSLFAISISQSAIPSYFSTGVMTTISSPVIAAILSFLIIDLYMYIWHRSMHIVPLAWRFHRVHHTDRYMNVSTAYRFHSIEVISSSIPKLILIIWLGITANFVLAYELAFVIVVALHHSNLTLPIKIDRLLARIIVTPNYHRIHHSEIIAESNSNYGSILTCWDWLFWTQNQRFDPTDLQLGLSDERRDLNIWQLIALPFKNRSWPITIRRSHESYPDISWKPDFCNKEYQLSWSQPLNYDPRD